MDTFKVMLLLSHLASLDNNLAHDFKIPFIDLEIIKTVILKLRKKIYTQTVNLPEIAIFDRVLPQKC